MNLHLIYRAKLQEMYPCIFLFKQVQNLPSYESTFLIIDTPAHGGNNVIICLLELLLPQ